MIMRSRFFSLLWAVLFCVSAEYGMEAKLLVESMTNKTVNEAEDAFANNLVKNSNISKELAYKRAESLFDKIGFKKADRELIIREPLANKIGEMVEATNIKEISISQNERWEEFLTAFSNAKQTIVKDGAENGWKNFEKFLATDKSLVDALVEGTGVNSNDLFKKNLFKIADFPEIGKGGTIITREPVVNPEIKKMEANIAQLGNDLKQAEAKVIESKSDEELATNVEAWGSKLTELKNQQTSIEKADDASNKEQLHKATSVQKDIVTSGDEPKEMKSWDHLDKLWQEDIVEKKKIRTLQSNNTEKTILESMDEYGFVKPERRAVEAKPVVETSAPKTWTDDTKKDIYAYVKKERPEVTEEVKGIPRWATIVDENNPGVVVEAEPVTRSIKRTRDIPRWATIVDKNTPRFITVEEEPVTMPRKGARRIPEYSKTRESTGTGSEGIRESRLVTVIEPSVEPASMWKQKAVLATVALAAVGVVTAVGIGGYVYQAQLLEGLKKYLSERRIWGVWSLYYNELDAVRKQYVYGNTSGISTAQLQQASTDQLENKLITDWFVCGQYVRDAQGVAQKNSDGSLVYAYGTPFEPDKTQFLVSLVTFEQYDRNGNVVGWFGKTGDVTKLQTDMVERVSQFSKKPADYAAITKALGIAAFDSLRLAQRITQLRTQALTRLQTERKTLQTITDTLAQETPKLDLSVQALVQTSLVQGSDLRKAANGNYYKVVPTNPADDDVVYIVSYNATTEKKDSKTGYVYELAPAPLASRSIVPGNGYLITGKALDLLRLEAGVIVATDGVQTLREGPVYPNIDVAQMLPLTQKDAIAYQQKSVSSASAQEKALYKKAFDASNAIAQAQKAGFIKEKVSAAGGVYAQSQARIDGFYLDAQSGNYMVKMSRGANDAWFASLTTGNAYDVTTGQPRVRPVFTFEKNTVLQQVLVNTKDSNNIALFKTDGLKLQQIEFQSPWFKQATTHASYVEVAERTVQNTDNKTLYIEYKLFTGAPLMHSVLVKESPVTTDYMPTQNTTYTISEKLPGYLNFKEVGTYQYDPKLLFSSLMYYETDGKGYVEDDARAIGAVAFIWNGDDARVFKKIHYQRQLIDLSGKGDTFTGSIHTTKLQDDDDGITREVLDEATRQITVTKRTRTLYQGITESFVTITDDGVTYNFMYQPTVIADIQRFVRDVVRMTSVTDAYGITRLVYTVPKKFLGRTITGTDVKDVPADKQNEVDARMSSGALQLTQNNKLILYRLQKNDPLGNLSAWSVDLATGIVYDVLGVPQGSLNLVQLQTILDTLHVRVTTNAQGDVALRYYGD